MNTALMVAFHYPPFSGSSSVHRTVSFARQLPVHGWEPIILTARESAYSSTRVTPVHGASPACHVERAAAFDAARHLALWGRYSIWLSLPDRWSSWYFGALLRGTRIVRKYRPKVLWSTYPIATAHLIALSLHRLTGIPWVADFRDPMTEDGHPEDSRVRWAHEWIERRVISRCRLAVFTAPGTMQLYARRYSALPEAHWEVIPNGFDESDFLQAERLRPGRSGSGDQIVLVHSGLLYRSERDPRAFFDAVRDLRRSGAISAADLRIVLRASGDEAYHREQLRERGIEDIVQLAEPLPYVQSLAEVLEADGLLVLQASSCNRQIPAKIYEYLRARRPILALTDPESDTATVLRQARVGRVARLHSSEEIAKSLTEFIADIRGGRGAVASEAEIQSHSRKEGARRLAEVFDRVASRHAMQRGGGLDRESAARQGSR